MVEMLTECGHAVCVARSGREAVEQFEADRHDLVFTDLGMPGMSGWDVARASRALTPSTPVVLLTGWGKTIGDGRGRGFADRYGALEAGQHGRSSAIVSEAWAQTLTRRLLSSGGCPPTTGVVRGSVDSDAAG